MSAEKTSRARALGAYPHRAGGSAVLRPVSLLRHQKNVARPWRNLHLRTLRQG